MGTYLFLDRRLLQPQGMSNAHLRVSPVEKDTKNGPLFTEDFFADPPRPWEVRFDNGYPNVIYDAEQGVYRCYYTLFWHDEDAAATPKALRPLRHYRPTPGRRVGVAYARSADGVHWEKPDLGLVEFCGDRHNNLISTLAHGTGVMLDPDDPDPNRRYKMVTKVDFAGMKTSHMAVNFSPDGEHWGDMIPWPEHNPRADSHNFPYFDKKSGLYRVMTRCWRDGVRVETSCESADFLHWSEPREVLRGDGFERQIYAMPVFMSRGLYFGLAAIFHEGDRSAEDFDTVDCELFYATEPDMFDAVAPGQPIIPRGQGYYPLGDSDCGCVYASAPVDAGDGYWFYYMGGNGLHTDFRETSLMRGWMRKDRFAGYEQKREDVPAVLATAQLLLGEGELTITADIAPGGYIRAGLRSAWNEAELPGFGEADCALEEIGAGLYRVRLGGDKAALRQQPVCLTLRFGGARVFALGGDVTLYAHRLWEGAAEKA